MGDDDGGDREDGLSFADVQFTPLLISALETMPNSSEWVDFLDAYAVDCENTPLWGAFSNYHAQDFEFGNLVSSSLRNSGFPQSDRTQMSDRAISLALSGNYGQPDSLGTRRSPEIVSEHPSMQDAVNRSFDPYLDDFDQHSHDESLFCGGVTWHISSSGQRHAFLGSGGSELKQKSRSQFDQRLQERPSSSSSEDSAYYAARRGPLDLNPPPEGYLRQSMSRDHLEHHDTLGHMSSNHRPSSALPQNAMQNHRSWEAARQALSQQQKRRGATHGGMFSGLSVSATA
eukprot:TRINITY_DN5072_c1_g1_i1.p1 TRINITY_DN5072_c1_g1~~TRINITY_DN5072_c1_g1_i1.p1  ORF type:complete len:287 (-),score=20.31 TRINITY_DN5072_c1_g1_i1:278-1138(-)